MKLLATLGVGMLLVPNGVPAWIQQPVPHWVASYPSTFDIFQVRDTTWLVYLYAGPRADSLKSGVIEVTFADDAGFAAEFRALNSDDSGEPIDAHLYDPDWGYGPWFHITVLERDGGWVRLQVSASVEPLWADLGSAFGDEVGFHNIARGEILSYDESNIVVEYLNSDGLIAREEQDADMHCGDPNRNSSLVPYDTFLIERDQWIDGNGRSRFSVPYTRGC